MKKEPSSFLADLQKSFKAFFQQEDLNFLLTNRVPRIALTRFMGWFSKIKNPWVRDASIAVWKAFSDLDLSEAKKSQFDSLHDCFVRELKDGARVFDPDPRVLASPCDAVVGACGNAEGLEVWQAKGFAYTVSDLFGNPARAEVFRDGVFVTLRLTSSMYHRFHAPANGRLEHVTHTAGDTWNVNPIALKRVERLFCKNERAALHAHLDQGCTPIAMVPVAAILVASLRLHFLNLLLHVGYRGPNELPCDASMSKGQELGWFQHGSTIIVFAPKGCTLATGIEVGARIRAGQALMILPQ
jgi:phosphatidylserine decarboxylase